MKNNREIKFRVWSKKYNKWINNCAVIDCDGNIDSHFLEIRDNGERIEHIVELSKEENIIQQFTGLLDKNNKEIYEGDIINFETYGIPHGPERDFIKNAEVYYDEKLVSFCFGRFNNGEYKYTYQMTDRIDKKTLEVVGNIFEKKI